MQIDQKRSDDTLFAFFSGFSEVVMTQEQNHYSDPSVHDYFSSSKVSAKICHQ